jgi:cytochrome c oxidase subunit II
VAVNEQDILRTELRWAVVVAVAVGIIVAVIVVSSAAMVLRPPSNVETIDPATLHVSGEFIEANLGATQNADGSITARIVATQFAFIPRCVAVPVGRPIQFRITSPDVIHGLLIDGTNVNTMVIPGYISHVNTTFPEPGDRFMPCHEYCGLGHGGMWSMIRVVPQDEWKPDANGRVSCEFSR